MDDLADEFHGKVVKKNWTGQSKQVNSIELDVSGKQKIISIYEVDDKFYQMIVIGDSIYKSENSRDVTIIRGNKEFTYQLQCGINSDKVPY